MNQKRIKRYLALTLSIMAATLITVSVMDAMAEGSEVPEIRVIMMSGSEHEGMKKVAEAYMEKTGNPVVVEGQGRGEYHAVLPTQLFSRSTGFDIAWIQNTWLPEFAEADALLALDDFLHDESLTASDYNIEDIFGVGVYKGKTYAIPTDVSSFFLFYRGDLIQDPPETWDDVYKLAKEFSRATNPDSPTKYGITGDYITGEVLPQTWWNFMWSMGGEVIDKDGNVVVDQGGALEAGRFMYQLAQEKLVPPNLSQIGWTDQEDQFINGDAAMIVPGWNAAYFSIPSKGGTYANQLKATVVPGVRQSDGTIRRTPYAHSWNFIINGASLHPKEAWQFLQFATSKEGMLIYAKTGFGNPPRASVMGDPEIQKERADFPLLLETLQDAGWADPVVYFNKIFEALDIALAEILNLRQTPEEALKEAARKIREAQQ